MKKHASFIPTTSSSIFACSRTSYRLTPVRVCSCVLLRGGKKIRQLLDEKFMGPPVTYGKSLNKEFRKRELMRITEENLVGAVCASSRVVVCLCVCVVRATASVFGKSSN